MKSLQKLVDFLDFYNYYNHVINLVACDEPYHINLVARNFISKSNEIVENLEILVKTLRDLKSCIRFL